MFATQNWYCAATTEELGDALLGRRIIKQDIVLFRDEQGHAKAIDAMCAHRGGNLAKGRCVKGTVECPWHGWRYGGDGKCRLVPSVGAEGKIPGLAKVSAYPVHEAQGFIYVWMNAEVAPDWQPAQHDFLDARYNIKNSPRVQQGNYISTVEAACDDSHVYIAHRKTIGRGAPPQLPPISHVKTDENGRGVEGRMIWSAEQKRKQGAFEAWYNRMLIGASEYVGTHDKSFRVELTGLVIHRYTKADGNEFIVYAFTTPIDERTNWFLAGVVDTNPNRPLIGNLLYLLSSRSILGQVFDEDEDMISSALSDKFPGGHPRPVSVNADMIGLGFRRIYAKQVQAEGIEPAWPAAGARP
ncbi:MAG: Rieske 2Fe-2S domain-containing protein [Pseudomonadota bacterium]